jgi:hypothetical protein
MAPGEAFATVPAVPDSDVEPPVGVRRLGGPGVATRALATALLLGAIAYGSVAGNNKLFPVGPMTQYAFYVPPDGLVRSTTVWADTTAGTHVKVRLDPHGVGVKRADVEAQLPAILRDPSLLRTISTAQRRLHPHQPQYTRLYVMQTVYQLHNRVPVGTSVVTLATWTVRP